MWTSARKDFTRVIPVHAVSIRMEDSAASAKHNLVNLVSKFFKIIKCVKHFYHVPHILIRVSVYAIKLRNRKR